MSGSRRAGFHGNGLLPSLTREAGGGGPRSVRAWWRPRPAANRAGWSCDCRG